MSSPVPSRPSRRSVLRAAAAISGSALLDPLARAANPGAPTWISTTAAHPWQTQPVPALVPHVDSASSILTLDTAATLQAIQGFGACFNELGWTALAHLSPADRDHVLDELFARGVGANLTLCRMPIAANDFSRGWYSFDETPGDFSLSHFSIANDEQTLIPFIHAAQARNPGLQLWASPWSPPTWMKRNGHYAEHVQYPGWPDNGIRPDQLGHEGEDMFCLEQPYLDAYARYFARFITAYRERNILIGMVMPQNEFNSAQPFPSCTWTPAGLAKLLPHLHRHLSPLGVKIFFGTLERANPGLLNAVLADPAAGPTISGVGLQWAGKGAIAAIHRQHPKLTLMQSEQECGDGTNTWAYATYTWQLMHFYLADGAQAYMYWNFALEPGGRSHWGWPQNSFLTVDPSSRTARWNHDYFVFKHLSHFVQPGARLLQTSTAPTAPPERPILQSPSPPEPTAPAELDPARDLLAFRNPDGTLIVVGRNPTLQSKAVTLRLAERDLTLTLPADSLNTISLPA